MRRTAPRTGMSTEVRSLLWTAAGVVVAPDHAPATQPINQNGTAATGGTVINNSGYLNFQQQVPPGTSDADVRSAASAYANVAPPADGPAPFRVVDTQDLGLKVRTTPTTQGVQIGSAANATTLWVDCAATTDFDPVTTDGVGPRWLRVHWPATTFHNSDPESPDQGWVYAGLTVPAGHNGQVREC